jgi:hypothetical protein
VLLVAVHEPVLRQNPSAVPLEAERNRVTLAQA